MTNGSCKSHLDLSFRDRDREVERCASAELALEPDAPTLHFDQALGDVKSKTCAGHFPCF